MPLNNSAQRAGESGIAMVLAIWLTIIVAGVVTTGVMMLKTHREKSTHTFARDNQAIHIARSGITEARAWLNRQTSQPVTTFEPILDNIASPPILDTIDADIGIVREFPVSGRTWARYEVWKEWDSDPDPDRLALRQQFECEDVSLMRSASAAGSIWKLRCMGYVFHQVDDTVAFDVEPNRIIAKDMIQLEVQRLVLTLPGQAALNVRDGNNCHINTMGRIYGGGTAAGIYYPTASGTPTTGSGQRVFGSPPEAGTAGTYDDSYEAIFSASLDQLKAMADMVLTDHTDLPMPVPNGSLIIVEESSMNFDATNNFEGSGILILIGNVTLAAGNLSNFSGIVYIDGGFTMRDPAEIRGAVIVTGNMTLQGNPDYAAIYYDQGVLDTLRHGFSQYRPAGAFHRPLTTDR